MPWTIDFADVVEKQLAKLSIGNRQRIEKFLTERVASLENPRSIGKPLKGTHFSNLWRYQAGDYRIICQIQDRHITILVVKIGNRREVYKKR